MAEVYVQGGQTVNNVNTNVERISWERELADQYKQRAPLYMLSQHIGMGNEPVTSTKFSWGEYTESLPQCTVSDTVSADSTIDIGTSDHFEALLADDVLYDTINKKYLRIVTTPTAVTNIVVQKLNTSTKVWEDLDTNDEFNGGTFLRITNMKADGNLELETNLDKISYFTKVADEYNYVQNIENYAKIDQSKANDKWEFDNITRREHQQAVMYQRTVDDIERLMFAGVEINGSTTKRYGSRGFINFGVQSQTGVIGEFSWNDFKTFTRTKARKESQLREIDAFVNPYMLQVITNMAENVAMMTMDSNGMQDEFGLEFFKLRTPQMTYRLRDSRCLEELYPDQAVMFCIDLKKIGIRHKKNMNLMTDFNIQPKRAKFFLDRTSATVGTILMNAGEHSMLVLSES